MKQVQFLGDSRARLRTFPKSMRQDIGFQLERVQSGLDPNDWKPMKGLGAGVREIRIRDEAGAFRLVYIATFAEAVYVLHAFQKKTPRTSPRDIWLAKSRLSELKRGMNR